MSMKDHSQNDDFQKDYTKMNMKELSNQKIMSTNENHKQKSPLKRQISNTLVKSKSKSKEKNSVNDLNYLVNQITNRRFFNFILKFK